MTDTILKALMHWVQFTEKYIEIWYACSYVTKPQTIRGVQIKNHRL